MGGKPLLLGDPDGFRGREGTGGGEGGGGRATVEVTDSEAISHYPIATGS